MGKIKMKRYWISLLILFLTVCFVAPRFAQAARLKDVVDIEGVRDNQLIGFGLVMGLSGTGDSSGGFTTQSLVMMLERMGISSRGIQNNIKAKNVASVMATATLPPFARQGGTLDVTVSSLGDSKSLQGGTLILTPLKGADGKIYAVAQGAISIGGFQAQGGGGGQQSHPTVGRIVGGASVEQEVDFQIDREKQLQLSLKNPDFTTANRIVYAINNLFGKPLAHAKDSGTVTLQVPLGYRERVVSFIARLERLQIDEDMPARVVINERTGTIVMGEKVRISTVALSHGNLSVSIRADAPMDQPPPFSEEEAAPAEQPADAAKNVNVVEMAQGVTLGELIKGLNSVGVTPRDLIAILQAIKVAGALQAELEIL